MVEYPFDYVSFHKAVGIIQLLFTIRVRWDVLVCTFSFHMLNINCRTFFYFYYYRLFLNRTKLFFTIMLNPNLKQIQSLYLFKHGFAQTPSTTTCYNNNKLLAFNGDTLGYLECPQRLRCP